MGESGFLLSFYNCNSYSLLLLNYCIFAQSAWSTLVVCYLALHWHAPVCFQVVTFFSLSSSSLSFRFHNLRHLHNLHYLHYLCQLHHLHRHCHLCHLCHFRQLRSVLHGQSIGDIFPNKLQGKKYDILVSTARAGGIRINIVQTPTACHYLQHPLLLSFNL